MAVVRIIEKGKEAPEEYEWLDHISRILCDLQLKLEMASRGTCLTRKVSPFVLTNVRAFYQKILSV